MGGTQSCLPSSLPCVSTPCHGHADKQAEYTPLGALPGAGGGEEVRLVGPGQCLLQT